MEKIKCDIIQDLIPSYVDEVCSEATRQCLEEHLKDCGECQRMISLCKKQTLSGEKLEQKGFDGLKKIRGNVICYQKIIYCLMAAFLAVLGIKGFGFNSMPYNADLALFVVCVAALLVTGVIYKAQNAPGKVEYILGAVSLALDLAVGLMIYYLTEKIFEGAETVWGMELASTGPFYDKILIISFVAQVAFFCYNIKCIIGQSKNCIWLLCLNMMGMFMVLGFGDITRRMDTAETLTAAVRLSVFQLMAIGILGAVISFIISRAGKSPKMKHEKNL